MVGGWAAQTLRVKGNAPNIVNALLVSWSHRQTHTHSEQIA